MLSVVMADRTIRPHSRGYHAVYFDGEVNHCPGCGRTHWLIGRLLAECAFCSTAIPLDQATRTSPRAPVIWHKNAR